MNDVDKKINNKVGALVKAKKEINDDVQAITQSIKEEIFQMDNLERRVNNSSKDVSSIGSFVQDLKEKMKSSKAEKIITVKDEPVKCKNCKTDPCLNGKLIIMRDFVDGIKIWESRGGSGCTPINGSKKWVFWDREYVNPQKSMSSLKIRYSC